MPDCWYALEVTTLLFRLDSYSCLPHFCTPTFAFFQTWLFCCAVALATYTCSPYTPLCRTHMTLQPPFHTAAPPLTFYHYLPFHLPPCLYICRPPTRPPLPCSAELPGLDSPTCSALFTLPILCCPVLRSRFILWWRSSRRLLLWNGEQLTSSPFF